MSQKITPFIRCVDNAKEVLEYYVTIFPGAKITKENPIVVECEIFGQAFATINGGPHAVPTPAISFSLWIRDLELTKQIWGKLMDGGSALMDFAEYPWSKGYGRCSDKFGVSRQVMFDERPEHTTNTLIPSFMFIGANAGKAEEAMQFYTSLFPASKIESIFRYGPNEHDVEGTIAHAEFTLVNQLFIALDSSLEHKFAFDDGVSLAISCADQVEVDFYREKLTEDGGSEVQCGRCKDKYGVSRQVVPVQIQETIFNADPAKAKFAMDAMMKMKKMVIADLYMK